MDDMTDFMHTISRLRAIFLLPSPGLRAVTSSGHARGSKLERRVHQPGF